MSKNKSTPTPERYSKNYNSSILLVEVSFSMCGVFRAAGIRVGSLRDRRRLGFLAWGARGTRSALARLRNFPFRPKKILSHRLACIATSANVSDANDFAHVKNQAKEMSACGREQL